MWAFSPFIVNAQVYHCKNKAYDIKKNTFFLFRLRQVKKKIVLQKLSNKVRTYNGYACTLYRYAYTRVHTNRFKNISVVSLRTHVSASVLLRLDTDGTIHTYLSPLQTFVRECSISFSKSKP